MVLGTFLTRFVLKVSTILLSMKDIDLSSDSASFFKYSTFLSDVRNETNLSLVPIAQYKRGITLYKMYTFSNFSKH